jgi:hypothetical protein
MGQSLPGTLFSGNSRSWEARQGLKRGGAKKRELSAGMPIRRARTQRERIRSRGNRTARIALCIGFPHRQSCFWGKRTGYSPSRTVASAAACNRIGSLPPAAAALKIRDASSNLRACERRSCGSAAIGGDTRIILTQRVLSSRVSIIMQAAFCVETLKEALAKHGNSEIFNTDQSSQFTGAAFTGLLIKNGIAIGMDGKVHGETPSSSRGCAQCGSGPTRAFRDY